MYARRIAALSVGAMLLAVGLIAGLPTAATSKPDAHRWPRPFVGLWSSVDVDGSNQYLRIKPGDQGLYRVSYYDDMTLCGFPAFAYGGASADGLDLTVAIQVWCLEDPPRYWLPWDFTVTYDPGTDTLVWDPPFCLPGFPDCAGDWTRFHGRMPG